MSEVEMVRGKSVLIRFEGRKCIHSRQCVLSRPDVFVPNVEGEWIHPDEATPEEIAALAESCPSGAIGYERLDGGQGEPAPRVNVVRLREDGPLAFHAEMAIEGHGNSYRATLCRCGGSKNQPFCDKSHESVGFVATGEPVTQESKVLASRAGLLNVRPLADGPVLVEGNLEICAGSGRTLKRVTKVALCRCGHSSNKPFCDGSHAAIDFKSG